MSSTLYIKKTPKPTDDEAYAFKLPIKGMIAEMFYGHDGTLGGEKLTIGPEHLKFFRSVRAGSAVEDRRKIDEVIAILEQGDSVDMWFEV